MTTMLYAAKCSDFDKKEIYFTDNEVSIDTTGKLYNEGGFPLLEYSVNGINWVTFKLVPEKVINVRIDVLVSIVFKDYKLPLELLELVKLYYRDGNTLNIHPTNLAHQLYSDDFIIEHEGNSYKIIPNFTNYAVSRDGKIIHRRTLGHTSPYKRKDNYVCFNIFSDINQKWVNTTRHRVLCLTYKPYPVDVDKLDVNHEDGVPGNDTLNNLEWRTRSYNNLHAVRFGFNPTAEKVEVRDILSEKVTIYDSIAMAARAIGISDSVLKLDFKRTAAGELSRPHHQYRHPSTEPWPIITLTRKDLVKFGKIEVDGELFDNFRELSNVTGINPTTLNYRFRNTDHIIPGKYCRVVLGKYYCLPGQSKVYNIE